jgi:cell division protein FtsI/penicillin-binding protein 2
MRPALAVMCLVAAACVSGSGVEPGAGTTAPTTTGSVITTTTSGPATPERRADAIAMAERFYSAITAEQWDVAAALVIDPPSDFRTTVQAWWGGLDLTDAGFEVVADQVTSSAARLTVRLDLELAAFGPWSYEVDLDLIGSNVWGVAWSPSSLYPGLEPGDTVQVSKEWPTRGSLLARDGTLLAGEVPVKVVGVVPGQIAEMVDEVSADLERLLGIEPGVVTTEISKPGVQPDWFVPVGTVSVSAWQAVEDDLDDLVGVIVRDGTERQTIESPFADQLIGRTGPITAEQLEQWGQPYDATRVVGRSGLEVALEDTLAGRPLQRVNRVNKFGRAVETIFEVPGRPAETVRLTLAPDLQRAAEEAVEGIEQPVALVVLHVPTGEVRASAVRPLDGFDRAFQGLYPPGSTFKVVTATALMDLGVVPGDEVPCPGTIEIQGRTFRNAGTFDLGDIDFRSAFSNSCNTTFASLAVDVLGVGDLDFAARNFGFDVDYATGVPTPGASFPDPPDLAGRAAAAIGQGSVLVTPLHQASVAAAVAFGGWRPPQIIDGSADVSPIPLDGTIADRLDAMMRLVVTDGTGQAADVGGFGGVRGKTGSAEFVTDGEIGTHAWFIGYAGDLAFAVVVEGGGGGGAVAAPIAADFLRSISG